MMPFQIGAILVLALVSAFTVRAMARHRLTPLAGTLWLALWLTGAIAIAWPDVTVRVARMVGIARGADLVSYLSILAMLFGFFVVNVRMRRIESQITRLARELALRAPEEPGDSGEE